jgi:putative transcriptional regulator|tara:strand:+ start:886 stop:1446 length:561 start_codon:yes stop_codon:yes gene_type:complete
MEHRVGKLLIAHPTLPEDSPFSKTVIYVYQENPLTGAVGIVLNKPGNKSIQQLCYEHNVHDYPHMQPKIHYGGPVNPGAMVMLHTDEWNSQNTAEAGRNLRISSDRLMLHKIAAGDEPIYWRICLGICTWQPGQLDMELKGQFPYSQHNRWLTAVPDDNIVFVYDQEDQWVAAVDACSQQTIEHFF